jgi:hypothetical protein
LALHNGERAAPTPLFAARRLDYFIGRKRTIALYSRKIVG